MIHGGCFCKKIRFAIEEGEYRVVNCFCSMCRKTSGAPYVTWVVVPKSAFKLVDGEPSRLKSSPQGLRKFCADCGTPMTFAESDRPEQVDVTVCSLDNPENFQPTAAVHEDSKLSWL